MPVFFVGVDGRLPGGCGELPTGDSLGAFLQGLPRDALLCLGRGEATTTAELRRHLLAGLRPDVRAVDLPLTSTALAVLASVTGSGLFPPGLVGALARRVVETSRTLAIVERPVPLPDLDVRLGQRILGRLPGTRFTVDLPAGHVRWLWRRPSPRLLEGQRAFAVSACAGDGRSEAWREALEAASLATGRSRVAHTPPYAWGVERWAELTLIPEPLDAYARALGTQVPVRPCRWCARPGDPGTCLYCGVGVRADAPGAPLSEDDGPPGTAPGTAAPGTAASPQGWAPVEAGDPAGPSTPGTSL